MEGLILSSNKFFAIAAFFFLLSFKTGCSFNSIDGHREAVKSATSVLPEAKEIELLFGDADHFISHYDSLRFGHGPKQWHTSVFFGGRYELHMTAEVTIDYTKNKITKVVSEPQFGIIEYYKNEPISGNRYLSHTRGIVDFFGPELWKVFFESGGDFSVFEVIKNETEAEFFSDLVSKTREPREKISLLQDIPEDKRE